MGPAAAPHRAAALLLVCAVARVAGHGAVVHPRSRNSVDAFAIIPAGANKVTWAPCNNLTGGACDNGQAAYWYSQGCFIGCEFSPRAGGGGSGQATHVGLT